MKAYLLVLVSFFSFTGISFSQEGLMKNISGAAKDKLKNQDFNSTRSNKEKGMLQNERKSAPAPAASPAPPVEADTTTAPANPETASPGTAVTDYKQSYSFQKKLVYETGKLGGSKEKTETISYYYGEGAVMIIDGDKTDMVTISDFDNEAAITFDEKNKTATVMSTRWATQMAEKYAKDEELTITKTGNTKKILGYNCEEYIVLDKKNKYVQWVTSDIRIDYSKAMATMVKNMHMKIDGSDMRGQTLLMEMTSYNLKKDEAEFHMIMTEYKEEATEKSLAGYAVTAL